MRFILPIILIIIGIILVFYLSWLPQPQLGINWFIPTWLANWADANSNNAIRTGVPFIFLGLFAGTWLILIGSQWYNWISAWVVLTLMVIIAEVGQLYLPHRSFDIKDIVWGATGTIVGLAVSITFNIISKLFKAIFKNLRRENTPN